MQKTNFHDVLRERGNVTKIAAMPFPHHDAGDGDGLRLALK
jgi:hypothetical protein